MADKKISQLTGATTPVGGTEVLPIVQGGVTKQVSVANLTAGRDVAVSTVIVGGRATLRSISFADAAAPTGNNVGIGFAGGPAIVATNAAGSATNGVADLGRSDLRFKDIHLAGNVVIGTAGKGIEASTGYVNASAYKLAAAGIITESGTSRTLSDADNGKVIYCTSGSAVTISCPDGLDVGFSTTIIQAGAGKVTLAASGTATLNSYSGLLSTMGQWAAVSVISPASDAFVATGNLGV